MVFIYVCNGFFQIRLGSYQMALPVPGILKLCNYLQNVVASTYIFGLQFSTFLFYNKHIRRLRIKRLKETGIEVKLAQIAREQQFTLAAS